MKTGVWYFTVYTVKKDEYMEQYTQTIRKNVYIVREKIEYLMVRRKNSLSGFLLYPCLKVVIIDITTKVR